jgi:putative aminopeptidase FrvX
MNKGIFNLLKKLSETPGPVGREERVQSIMRDHLKEHCREVNQDRIGNLVATMEGTGEHFAIVAHADEVGFLVSNIDENGFLKAKWNTQSYLPDLRLLPGQRIEIMTTDGFVPGCFCVKTAHIAGAQGKKRLPTWDEVFIDIGSNSADDVAGQGVNIGDSVLYASQLKQVGHNVMGKAMDDRIGLTIMIHLVDYLSEIAPEKRPTVTLVSTVMEELGAKGAAAIAHTLDVDGVFIVDIGLADDYPGTSGEAGVSLGKGPVIVIKDNQMYYSHQLNQRLFDAAEICGLPIQRAVYHNYSTDGFQLASQGQVVSTLGIPCRYSHSSFETLNLEDAEKTLTLLTNVLKTKL